MGKKHTAKSKKDLKSKTKVYNFDDVTVTMGGIPISGPRLKDTGNRTASSTGSLRDRPDGAVGGRFDLIPPECIAAISAVSAELPETARSGMAYWLTDPSDLDVGAAVYARSMLEGAGSLALGLRGLAILYGKGAKKYADRNWELGQPTGWLVDSMWRHAGKLDMGMTDEDHRAAVVWNCFALMYTVARIRDGRLPRKLDTYGMIK